MLFLYVGGVSGLMWASRLGLIYRGGCIVKQLLRLIDINRGGYLKNDRPVSIFCETVFHIRLG